MAPNKNFDQNFEPIANKSFNKEILYNGNLYDVSTFIHKHPGGHEILLNFTQAGEDATLAIQQFHRLSIDKVLKTLSTLPNRPEPEIKLSGKAEQVKQRNEAMTADFLQLYKEIEEENLFKTSVSHWIFRFMEWTAYGLLGVSLITESSNLLARFIGSVCIAMGMGRGAFIMHEFGHMSGTGNPKLDRFVQEVVMGISMGTSGIWWRREHDLHHAVTNRVEADHAVHYLPGLFIFNLDTLKDPKKDHTWFQRNQMYFLPFFAVLLYFQWLSWITPAYLYRKRKITEIVSIFCHYFIMYQIGFQMWLVTVTIFSLYFFLNLFINHTFVPVTTEPTHWIEQCFVNTVNVDPGRFSDWWMGYLNYQIEHHLFPTMPQFRIPLIVDRVKALGQKHGLPYHVYSYELTVRKAFKNLQQVSQFLKNIN